MGGEESWDFNKVFGLILIQLHSIPIVLTPLHKLVWNRISNDCPRAYGLIRHPTMQPAWPSATGWIIRSVVCNRPTAMSSNNNLLQTAEGAMNEVGNILGRMREL